MFNFNRILPEEVVKAYDIVGADVCCGDYFADPPDEGRRCYCGVGAVAMANGVDPSKAKYRGMDSEEWAEVLHVSPEYLEGFIIGFDSHFGDTEEVERDVEMQQGFADGKQAFQLSVQHRGNQCLRRLDVDDKWHFLPV